jgi:hypothetical protein
MKRNRPTMRGTSTKGISIDLTLAPRLNPRNGNIAGPRVLGVKSQEFVHKQLLVEAGYPTDSMPSSGPTVHRPDGSRRKLSRRDRNPGEASHPRARRVLQPVTREEASSTGISGERGIRQPAIRIDSFVAAGGLYTDGSYASIEGLIQDQTGERDRKHREATTHRIPAAHTRARNVRAHRDITHLHR